MKTLIYKENIFSKIPIGITNGDLVLKECLSSVADKFVIKYHYSHKPTKNRFKSFLVNNGLGVLQLGYGIRPAKKANIHPLIKK